MTAFEPIQSLLRILNHPLNTNRKLYAAGRVLWWKFNQLFFHLSAVVPLRNSGIKCICLPDSSYGSLVVYCNYPEFPEMTFLEHVLKSNNIFFDIGANIGVYSLIAASKIKEGKIYAFEPIPRVADILSQNAAINGLENRIRIFRKVVSEKNGKEKFEIYQTSEYSHISKNSSKGISIPSVKLDDFCASEKINSIDVIKIDVEGAEMKVLKGSEELLKNKRIKILIVELSTNSGLYGYNQGQVLEYLKSFGFLTFKINKNLKLEKLTKITGEIPTINIIAFLKRDEGRIKKSLSSAFLENHF